MKGGKNMRKKLIAAMMAGVLSAGMFSTGVFAAGTDLKGGGFTAPSDAIVLFDGKDLSAWESVKGGAAEWDVKDGVFTVNKKKGDIQTKQKFNDFQMHIEWQVPTNITGESQSRGNSGIFLQGMYEVQVLD